MRTTMTV